MDSQPTFGFDELRTNVVGDMVNALSVRDNEPRSDQVVRSLTAASAIMSFQPRDAIEAMLAGHCVMFHELIVDSIRATMHGEPDMSRRATRSGIVAMDKAFGANLTRLVEYRARQAEAQTAQAQKAETSAAGQTAASAQGRPADAPARGQKAEPRAETEIADRMLRHQTRSTPTRADPATAPDGEMVPIPTLGPDVQTLAASAAAPGGPHETNAAAPGQALAASRTPGEHRAASAGAPGQSGSSRPQPVDQPDALRAFPEADKAPARRQASP